jgi:RNA 3'-phosphate cyclase
MFLVSINGSFGEGGGQILRTALALSSFLKIPFEMERIRANRKKPGLQAQHLACVKALERITEADVEGAFLGSDRISFYPKTLNPGDYHFDVAEKRGSAGSVTLVLQGLILPLSQAKDSSHIIIRGGTHVPWSPSFNYTKEVFIPFLKSIGMNLSISIDRWGFYPKGGGQVFMEIGPPGNIREVDLIDRGSLVRIQGISAVSNLPISIAKRQREEAYRLLKENGFDCDIDIISVPSSGKGTFLFLLVEFENSRAGFGSLGAIGKKAEDVGKEAFQDFFEYYRSDAPLDPWMADQIIPYIAVYGKRGKFRTSRITKHLLTNCWVLKKFLPVEIIVRGNEGDTGEVIVNP